MNEKEGNKIRWIGEAIRQQRKEAEKKMTRMPVNRDDETKRTNKKRQQTDEREENSVWLFFSFLNLKTYINHSFPTSWITRLSPVPRNSPRISYSVYKDQNYNNNKHKVMFKATNFNKDN